jgi:hypothetical protein
MAHALDVERARMTLESLEADVRQEAGINQVPLDTVQQLERFGMCTRQAVPRGGVWLARAQLVSHSMGARCTAERAFNGLHLAADLCIAMWDQMPQAWGLAQWPQWQTPA